MWITARFRLPPDLDIAKLRLPRAAAVIARAVQKYGMVEGTVLRISADALDQQAQEQAAVTADSTLSPYKAIVRLEQQFLSRGDFRSPLAPGMQIVAEIKQGERTVLEYLLSPVQKTIHEAARER